MSKNPKLEAAVFMILSLLLALYKIVVHLKFFPLPLFFLALGLVSYSWDQKKSLYLFFFLFPLVNAAPDFFFKGYPFNYMGTALFYLSGIVLASWLRREKLSFPFKWARAYLFFLVILWISVLFLFLRWSNFTLSLLAFGKDTPVTPAGQLISFASIFPVITLFLFSVSPYIAALIKKNLLEEAGVFKSILCGYTISILVGLYQKFVDPDFMALPRWGEKLNQYNATFSDFNAFGFFSGVLFLYLAISLVNRFFEPGQRWLLGGGLLITLVGIFLSGCRTAFLFVLVAVAFLLVTKKIRAVYKLAAVLVILLLLAAAGGTLKKRMLDMVANMKQVTRSTGFLTALDKVTNGRIEMMVRSVPLVMKYPLTGVGGGNFLFYLKYQELGQEYWEDLPLNHYLLILDETGLIGLLVFVYFLVTLVRQKRKPLFTLLLAAILLALFFNFFFWFPEALLLFWIVSSFTGDEESRLAPGKPLKMIYLAGLSAVIFIFFNILHFDSLHPKTWANEKGKAYCYGFWYEEKNPRGEEYRWTKEKAGIYIYLDEKGDSSLFKLYCGAPLHRIKDKQQQVRIYWRGRLYKREIFGNNREFLFKIEKGPPAGEGFLEFRVQPGFNLREMNISEESRNLGIKFFVMGSL